jgi:hypothetical protein
VIDVGVAPAAWTFVGTLGACVSTVGGQALVEAVMLAFADRFPAAS